MVFMPVTLICNCGAGVGEALTLKTASKQYWPLVEMLTFMSGNDTEFVTSPLSKCFTSPPSIWRKSDSSCWEAGLPATL